jgi:transcriptional regulator with GAF, ATPase, and Fis domain
MVRQVATLDSPVLILGETGTGKELVATTIHQTSGRSDGPMIRVNCGAIPESLMDSELFGHEKGAFTGAGQLKRGYFEQADGGTIFLDEIGDLPLAAQVKLLRVLQTMEFHRVGGTWPVSVDVRVVAATNRNLSEMVTQNRFREDLWFRLNVFPISIPPLRHRKDDIPALAEYFVVRKAREMNLAMPPAISLSATRLLKEYAWPGNIRELQNVIERALILGRGHELTFDELIPKTTSLTAPEKKESTIQILSMDEMVKRHIIQTLKHTSGKVEGINGAADILKMHPSTLRSRMKKLGISISKSAELKF